MSANNIRDYINIVESRDPIQLNHRGSHSGQHDMTLTYMDGDQVLGSLDFSEYEGEVLIHMIEVKNKGKGIGSKLVKHLQGLYPEVELDWGMMTDEGSLLKRSLTFKKVETEYKAKFDELNAVKDQLDRLTKDVEDFDSNSNPTEEERQRIIGIVQQLNDLHDREYELEDETYGQKPYRYIIQP